MKTGIRECIEGSLIKDDNFYIKKNSLIRGVLDYIHSKENSCPSRADVTWYLARNLDITEVTKEVGGKKMDLLQGVNVKKSRERYYKKPIIQFVERGGGDLLYSGGFNPTLLQAGHKEKYVKRGYVRYYLSDIDYGEKKSVKQFISDIKNSYNKRTGKRYDGKKQLQRFVFSLYFAKQEGMLNEVSPGVFVKNPEYAGGMFPDFF